MCFWKNGEALKECLSDKNVLMGQLAACYANVADLQKKVADLEAQLNKPIPDQLDLGDVEPNSFYPLILARWPDMFSRGMVRVSSGAYHVTSTESLMSYIAAVWSQQPYIPTFHDCPDFAMALLGKFCNEPKWWGSAFGYLVIMSAGQWHGINIAFTYPNAYNMVIEMHIIEPQTARIVDAAYVGAAADFIFMP